MENLRASLFSLYWVEKVHCTAANRDSCHEPPEEGKRACAPPSIGRITNCIGDEISRLSKRLIHHNSFRWVARAIPAGGLTAGWHYGDPPSYCWIYPSCLHSVAGLAEQYFCLAFAGWYLIGCCSGYSDYFGYLCFYCSAFFLLLEMTDLRLQTKGPIVPAGAIAALRENFT
jgi:hypothetical protein